MNKKPKQKDWIKGHPLAIDLDRFMETEDYQASVNLKTLIPTYNVYLENRIRTAYQRGWNDAEKRFKNQAYEAFKKRK